MNINMQLNRKKNSTALVEDSGSSQPKHQSLSIAQDECLLCIMDGKSEQLHQFTTFNADKSIKLMAIEINDTYHISSIGTRAFY